MKPRRSPYTWATHITGILAGDDSCRWAAWAKSQHTYDKRPDANAENLATWKSEHADLVQRRAAELRAEGWTVTLEDQNKFTIKGRSTTLSGCPDIVATRELDVRVVDAKTGTRKGKDIWQVRIYQLGLPLTERFGNDARYTGEVAYKDGNQPVGPLMPDDASRILALLAEVGASTAPEGVPAVVAADSHG